MRVTEFLERARECAALADHMSGEHREAVLALAETWLKLADAEALKAQARAERQTARKLIGGKHPESRATRR